MKILQICKKNPFPARDGETKAIYAVTSGLMKEGCDVTVLTFNTTKHFVSEEDYSKAPFKIISVPLDNSINYWNIFTDFLRGKSPNFSRFHSIHMEDAIKSLLTKESYDIIHLEGSYLVCYIPIIKELCDTSISVRTHNVEYKIWERLGQGMNGFRQSVYNALASRMKRFEKKGLSQADAIVPISCEDESILKKEGIDKPYLTIPMGVNGEFKPIDWAPKKYAMAFLGSMDWEPNIEGIRWFLTKVWPKIVEMEPSSKLFLAGRNMPPLFENWNTPGLEVVGEVECPSEFLTDKQLVVIPLLSGSGMRIKAIEAMSLGVPVLSTSIGVEGIPYESDVNVIIADTPEDFANKAVWAIRNPENLDQISAASQDLIKSEFDNYKLSADLKSFYQKVALK